MELIVLKDLSLYINAIGACNSFILAIYFFKRPQSSTSYSHWLLSAIYFILSIIITNTLFVFAGYSNLVHFIEPYSNAFSIAMAPLLYLYVKEKRLWSWHIFPTCAVLFLTIINSIFSLDYISALLKSDLLKMFWHLQFTIYLFFSFKYFNRLNKNLANRIKPLLYGVFSIWLVVLIFFIVRQIGFTLHPLLFLNVTIPFTILILWNSYTMFESNFKQTRVSRVRPDLDLKSLLSLSNQLVDEIEQKEYFRSQDLSIRSLALYVGIPFPIVSQTINEIHKQNFNEFINGFRVKYVVKRLLSSDIKSQTIMAIAQDAGFRSDSAFYAAFKREKGMTPKKFIKDQGSLISL